MQMKQVLVVFLILTLSACSGSDGKNGVSALVRVDDEPAGSHCARGGLAVHTGLDADGDGVLADSEISQTRYVCNGEGTGASSLVSVDPEPVGGNCGSAAGQRIRVGLDANGNGQLDEEEVTSTTYVCNGTGEGINAMVKLTDEPAGGNCGPVSGIRVDSGLDTNRNGQLDDHEITATRYVCNGSDGQNGLSTLVNVSAENPGANCPNGGQKIQLGLDDSGDGLLQPGEVEQTQYVCNGAPGATGQNGLAGLVRQEDEPAGAHCPFGGRAILSGLDSNSNGYLEYAEVTSTGYVCNGAPGAPGHSTVFTTAAEPAGMNCMAGGYRIESGLDLDDDGVLDGTEVASVSYVCHGANGHDSLVSTAPVAAGGDCGAAAGQRIDVGVDLNGNGVLDPAEITQSRTVCNGADGHPSLVATQPEPAGVNCSDGGLRIESGPDVNGNGVLDPAEVTQTSYLCNGSGTTLVNAVSAAWGGVCPMGGVKVETGIDDDGNGVLDPAEVTRTQYVCNRYFVQIATADGSSCGLLSDGSVYCWGRNDYGQLGIGSTTAKMIPVKISGLGDVAQVSGGGFHFCALLNNGAVHCWGYNAYGQLGDGTTTQRTTPVTVFGLSNAVQVDAGYYHTCALLDSGSVNCWGRNNYGQLGDGTTTQRTTPATVYGLSNAAQVSAGMEHTCARLSTSSAVCWGYNGYGQLGDGSTSNRNTPGPVFGLTTVSQVSAGYYHTCAVLSTGGASCWGYNGYGQLGDGSTSNRNTPGPVSGLTSVSSVATALYASCAVKTDGTAMCWGYNNYGQIGDGTVSTRYTPVAVLELRAATRIADSLGYHFCAHRSENLPMCWGYNGYGQLGDNTTTNRSIPTYILWDNSL